VQFQLPETARRFRSRSLLENARLLLEARGVRTDSMSISDLAQRAMSSSDFPFITADVANKILRAAYASQPRTFLNFCRRSSLVDFKAKNLVKLGEAPQLKEVPVGGEIKVGSMAEARESYKLRTYGVRLTMTREMLINDDLDAFTKLAASFGIQAVVLENDIVWALMLAAAGAGATMSDGVALFHANHANLNTGVATALSVDGLSTMRQKMRLQKGIDGKTLMNLQLAHLLVPTTLETKAQQLTTQTNVAKDGDVNPFTSAFRSIVVEPRMDAVSTTGFIGAADPGQVDTIEYAYLEGNDGVRVETREGFETLGVDIRAVHDFGAGLVDHRGFQRNTGAA
jgi:hypothetical protein